MSVLRRSIQLNQPKIDINLFLAAAPESLASADPDVPSLLVYLLNIFAKAIVSQFIDEASVSPRIADPIGTIASHIFSLTDFRWQGLPLIDILIAKMHVVCPILWGIYGDETTPQGKARIGWWREEKDGPWVSEHRHKERMTGLGAGFAAIALRNYEKARTDNPYPNTKYWQSLAYIINTPAAEVTTTHFVVLKAMIENYETKFIDFFGNAALAVLRKALIDFPAVAVQQGMAAKALTMLVEVLRKDKKLVL
jgi:nucleoporin GLE1